MRRLKYSIFFLHYLTIDTSHCLANILTKNGNLLKTKSECITNVSPIPSPR